MSSTTVKSSARTEALRLPENCAVRVCYAPRTTPIGDHSDDHFIIEARVLADAIAQEID